jgi:hypothetical protein
MYISKPERYCTADGTQCCRMGRFLILLDTPEDKTIYAIVRTVALRQCGHWMMGSARIQGTTYTVSGAYGNDGLPMRINTLPPDAKLTCPTNYTGYGLTAMVGIQQVLKQKR